MSILDMSLHQQMGSEGDRQPSASSVSLPSVKKAPKQRRFSIGSRFWRKMDSKRKSGELDGGVEAIASIERIHSEMCADKNSIFSTNTSSDNGLTSINKQTGDFMDCPLCLLRLSQDRFPDIMTCHHRSCVDCLRQYLKIEISESRVNISCPECPEPFNPHDIRLILSDDVLMGKYEEFMLRQWLVTDPDCRWCPAPDCGYAVIAFGCARCPKLTCERKGCGTEFCYHCKQIWHPKQTCETALWERAQRLCLRTLPFSPISYKQESRAAADDIKRCPRCAAYIIKIEDGSCNHMTCAVCGCEFCWLCMKEISNLHYLSLSGCSLWGKKPWSRKKKILWQLGTLVGAPVGIALIAGIALPAMIIGIPVYVGRKIHDCYEGRDVSKHKRNMAIASGVTLSVIVSPVVAAVTIGIGAPTMLAYVYGVVPISLCRNRDCGESAGNGKGVRIEFDDENDINVGGTNTATDTTSGAEARHNPSIGEGSVSGLTGSLSASGSHMDGIGTIGNNLSETVGTIALAGASITGSLSGSAMVNCFSNLQVQAEVQKERCSLSRESGTVSLGRVCNNSSTKAMAGSILNSHVPLDREGNSMEVQVDVESKPFTFQHSRGSSSVDDSGAARGHMGRSSSGLPEGKSSATKYSKEATGGKKSKSGKLRKKGNMKINETGEHMDARLLRPQNTDLSEFEVPSLSDNMPSVAVSHCSHSSYLESMRMSCSHHSRGCHAHFPAVNTLPEVEKDGLKHSPHQGSSALLSKTASCSEVPQSSHAADEHGTN